MNPQWRQILSAFLIGCLLGGVAGARSQRWAMHRFWQRGPDIQRAAQKLNKELMLDPKQQEETKAILEKEHQKIMAIHQEMSAKFNDIRMAMRADIKALLKPDQQKKFDALTAKWDARHKQDGFLPPK